MQYGSMLAVMRGIVYIADSKHEKWKPKGIHNDIRELNTN